MTSLFLENISQLLNEPVKSCSPISGGDISEVYKLTTSTQELLLKTHQSKQAFAMLKAEKQGLEAIAETNTIKTPKVYFLGEFDNSSFLVMSYIASKNPDEKDFEKLGLQLAALHQTSTSVFGFSDNNFIGSLSQFNNQHKDWANFYVKERLQPQLDLAYNKSLISKQEIPKFDMMYKACDDLFPEIQPSLLHGDLWGGNYLIGKDGIPYLIDPAVYYGHNEVDLSMSRLFGGFSSRFYEAYHDILPEQPQNIERNDLYQLYYLLVHLNLFGSSYYSGVKRIIEKYFVS